MNNERMIAVSSGLIERAVSLLDLLPESGTIIELRAALATQPAAGDPTKYWAFHNEDGELCITDRWDVAKHFPFDLIPLVDRVTVIAPPAAAHGDSFRTWLTAEMPAGTVIGDPSWWAEHILKRIGAAAHWDEAVRKDAERYRWLRDYWIGDDPASINMDSANRRGLNAAIDAAMRAQAGEGGEV